ncbi:MAG: molybdate ABC transporter substrate-binding protein [Treponema sp.]|nr:molybdate ABC transporter substrate-binding protein [Treponema sp.]
MKKALLLTIGLVAALALAGAQEKVRVAAAANVSSVADRLSSAFERSYPQYRLQFIFGASGALVTQILNGAPYQVFLSADSEFPRKLVDAGYTDGPEKVYAVGTLIFLSTRKLDLSKGLAVLADPSVTRFAICNPETAPYGRAALEALVKAGLYESVKPKLVTAQTVTEALQYTLTGVDAGFVNKSALYSKDVKPYDREGRYWFAVDPSLYAPIYQAFVVVKGASASAGVRAFVAFLSSPASKAIFASYGYGTP